MITVLDRLGDDTYKPYLVQLVESLPSVRGLSEYIRIVSEESRRANAVSRLGVALTRLQSGEPLEDVQNAVALTAQSMSGHEGSSVSAADGFLLVADSLEKPRQYIGTGFRKLDSLLFIAPGDFVVIGARPSVGKTAFSLQMALHMARAKKVIYFSCETSAQKIYERALACYGNLSFRQIKQGEQMIGIWAYRKQRCFIWRRILQKGRKNGLIRTRYAFSACQQSGGRSKRKPWRKDKIK